MRSEVVAKNAKKAPKKAPIGDAQTLNVAKYRSTFGLAKDENLMLVRRAAHRHLTATAFLYM